MSADRSAAAVAAAIAVALGVTAWTWRTGAVGGSDSACYALMARAYADGGRQPSSALALEAPWPEATRVAAPGGFLPSESRAGAAVPICAPGYGLLTAPLVRVLGGRGVQVVPPVAAAALVWVAFLLGCRLAGGWAGVGAAVLTACHPIVLFQAVQPMNDIATGTIWVAAAWAAVASLPVLTGTLAGLGVLVRPNLAGAAVLAVLAVAWMAAGAPASGRWTRAVRAAVVAGLAMLPGVVAALVLNASLYGSPLRSGYGQLEALFAWAHVPQNLAQYGGTWLATSTPAVLLALASPWVLPPASRPAAWVVLLMAAALSAIYLVYRPFPDWWYLRFLLPAVVLSLVLVAASLDALGRRVVAPWRHVVPAALTIALALTQVGRPETAEAFTLQRLEARFPLTADVVATRVAPTAVAITSWQSGAIRFGPGREVVMWDALDPAWLDRAIAWLDARGRPAVIVLETWEEEGFRRRFSSQVYGALDWPPRLDIDRRVHLFVPADRERYRRGEHRGPEPVFVPR